MRHILAIGFGAMLLSGAALAQSTTVPGSTAPGAMTSGSTAMMTDAQIKQKLEAQGYSNVTVTQHAKDHVDVTAMKNGKPEKLAVNGQTGQASPATIKD